MTYDSDSLQKTTCRIQVKNMEKNTSQSPRAFYTSSCFGDQGADDITVPSCAVE